MMAVDPGSSIWQIYNTDTLEFREGYDVNIDSFINNLRIYEFLINGRIVSIFYSNRSSTHRIFGITSR